MNVANNRKNASIDERQVSAYLTKKLGEPVAVKKMKQSFPGSSRQTWMVNAVVGKLDRDLVLRIDHPEGGSCPNSMKTEFEVYKRLYGSEVPVAQPLWYDEDNEFADGRPLMVRELVDGSPTISGLYDKGADELRRQVVYEAIEKLAAVHMLDWQSLGFGELLPEPPSASQTFEFLINWWKQAWYDNAPLADPVFEEVLDWIAEIAPSDTPHISLAKGNNGVGEEIWKDRKIVAMSDWELASLGDGLTDLFWSQGTLRLIDFKETLQHYERCTNIRISIERLSYANLFVMVTQYITMHCFWYKHLHEQRTKRIYALPAILGHATDIRSRLARCVGKCLPEAWEIANSKAEKSMYTNFDGV